MACKAVSDFAAQRARDDPALVFWNDFCNEEVDPYHVAVEFSFNLEEARDRRYFERDAAKFVATRLQRTGKGAEVALRHLSPEQLKQFAAAKQTEIKSWIEEAAVSAARDRVPSDRLTRMRWVLNWRMEAAISRPRPDW